jgi:FkbM family methyltransferase
MRRDAAQRVGIDCARHDGERSNRQRRPKEQAPVSPPALAMSRPARRGASRWRRLRPTKVRSALRRRWFELAVSHAARTPMPELADLGSAWGGWTVPEGLIEPSWLCYSVGAGADISFDLELIRRHRVRVRAVDPVAEYVSLAARHAQREPRLSVHHAAIALVDGPVRMQVTHDPVSRSVSAAGLYDGHRFVELPGRTLSSLMAELGDGRVDLLKLDVEGSEYDVIPTLDLQRMGVKVLATQLHHTGSVRDARALIARLERAGYVLVACRAVVKLTFVRRDLLASP